MRPTSRLVEDLRHQIRMLQVRGQGENMLQVRGQGENMRGDTCLDTGRYFDVLSVACLHATFA